MSLQYVLHPAHELAELVQTTLRNQCRWTRSVAAHVRDDGGILLTGRVASFYQKQMAQEALRHIQGIGRIHNELRVETLETT